MEPTAGSTSSTDPAANALRTPAVSSNLVVIGTIRTAHGLSGQLRVRHVGDDPENLLRAEHVFVGADESSAVRFEVADVAPGRRGEVRLRLVGIEDRDRAETFGGQNVMVAPAQLQPLAGDEYYGYELVGCRVETRDGRELGRISGIWSTGAADLLVVETESGGEHMIPANREFLVEVDIEGQRVVVELIPGLIESS